MSGADYEERLQERAERAEGTLARLRKVLELEREARQHHEDVLKEELARERAAHELALKFHAVAVKERDFERLALRGAMNRLDETEAEVERLTREHGEANEALAACQSQAAGRIAALESEVARLTAERDAEAENGRLAQDRLARVLAGRDEARAEVARLTAQWAADTALLREIARLLEADLGGWFVGAPPEEPLGQIRDRLAARLTEGA